VDMEFFLDPKFKKEKKKRVKTMLPYQVNRKLLGDSDALIMHDMPIHRGYEIADDLVESANSVIFVQSENRLHSAKAILLKLLG
jgi:ornithine carbamoyltransferase